MSIQNLVSRLFEFLAHRKLLLLLALAACLRFAFITLKNLSVSEDISTMLPDDSSRTAEDFRKLSSAQLLSRIFVILEDQDGKAPDSLVQAGVNIRSEAGAPWFEPMPSSSDKMAPSEAMQHLMHLMPATVSVQDLDRMEKKVEPDAVRQSLEQAREDLAGLQGIGLKKVIRMDPLKLRTIVLEKLGFLDMFGNDAGAVLESSGVYQSADRKSVLVSLESPVDMTDARGSREMLRQLEEIISKQLPDHARAHIISGHSYTVANADTIQKDLVVVLAVSALGILILYLGFVRTWRGLMVYAIPFASLLAGIAAVAVTSSAGSGITIGFGAVLMGLSVDYGLHVYYAVQSGPTAVKALTRVCRPILFCWLTTCGVFSMLFLSSLPGQRQLALFTISGLSAAMLLALMVLPVFLSASGSVPQRKLFAAFRRQSYVGKWTAVTVFLGLVLSAALCWPGISFDGRLQALNKVPEELAEAEQAVTESWGDVRGMAMIFSEGDDLDMSLKNADNLFRHLSAELPGEAIISLAPLLPPESRQQEAMEGWQKFWSEHQTKLKEIIDRESRDLGFSAEAFDPFFDFIAAVPQPVTQKELHVLGLGDAMDMLVYTEENSSRVVTMVPDNPEVHALFASGVDSGVQPFQDARLVSQELLSQDIAADLRKDITGFLVAAGVFVLALAALLFRDLRRVFQALLPAVAGLSSLIIGAALLGLEFNLFSIAAMFLVLGLGVDYGIFMTLRITCRENAVTERAVLVSGLTTLAGFGALTLADHPALYSIGVTILTGIGPAMLAAIILVPALEKKHHHG